MIKIIAAIGKNNELGKNNSLPLWKLQEDFKRFKELTTGGTVVMGRKTFESLPGKFRPLPNRKNVVITREKNWQSPGVETISSIDEINFDEHVWIIGGGEIYRQFIEEAHELHLTHVEGEFEADTFFPQIDEKVWKKVFAEKVAVDDKNSHNSIYTIYRK